MICRAPALGLTLLAVASCGQPYRGVPFAPPPQTNAPTPEPALSAEDRARNADARARFEAEVQARMARDQAYREQETALVPLVGSSDFPAALRRAAETLVALEHPQSASPTRRGHRPAPDPVPDRAEKVAAEEARLRGRVQELLTLKAQSEANRRTMQAEAICQARSQMASAAHPDSSLLGLNAMDAGINVRRACLNAFLATGVMPSY